jgi:hypothetical protein
MAQVQAVLEDLDGPPPDPMPEVRRELPIHATLARAVALRRCVEGEAYLKEKGLTREVPCGWLAHAPPWFRSGHPLVVPLFSGRGELKSMHGRAVETSSKTFPTGMSSSGLLMLDPKWARPWVRGGVAPSRVYLVEGFTDYLAMSLDAPAIGCHSGSFDALRLLPWGNVEIFTAFHQDQAGFSYEEKVASALWPRRVAKLPFDRLR